MGVYLIGGLMNISEVSNACGLSSKTIRFYEDKGVINAPRRRDNGYRHYSDSHLKELVFIKRIRDLGFTLMECKELLDFLNDPSRKSADVKNSMAIKLSQIEQKIEQMSKTRMLLIDLIENCPDNEHPDCSIIDLLSKID